MSIEWFEQTNFEEAIWIIKYPIFEKDGNFVEPDTPGATNYTCCHGWYADEPSAMRAIRELGPAYSIEKVYRRVLCPS